jgi:hypothetical protein
MDWLNRPQKEKARQFVADSAKKGKKNAFGMPGSSGRCLLHLIQSGVSSIVAPKRFWAKPQHVLITDCDSEKAADVAGTYLSQIRGHRYCKIQSSPGKYWLVTDFVSDIKTVLAELKLIPGSDPNFHKMGE